MALAASPGLERQTAPLHHADADMAAVLAVDSAAPLHVLTQEGLCYRGSFSDLVPQSQSGDGERLIDLIEGDAVCAVLPVGTASHYLLVSEQGEIKRLEEVTLERASIDGISAYRVALGDRVVAVVPHGYEDHVLLASARGQVLRLDMRKVRTVQTGDAGGVVGMKLAQGDRVVGAARVRGSHLLTIHASGAAKRVPLSDYPAKGRGGSGVVSAAVDKPVQGPGPAGEVVCVLAVDERPLALFSQDGQLLPCDPAFVTVGSRFVVSRPALKLVSGGLVQGAVADYAHS